MLMSVHKHLGTAVYSQCLASSARAICVCVCVIRYLKFSGVLLGDEHFSRLCVRNTMQLETT